MNETDYQNSLLQIQKLNERLATADLDYEKTMSLAIRNCYSALDQYDFLFSITVGILGAILDTNEKIAAFLDEIHQLSSLETSKSGNTIKDLFSRILHHQGDWMDAVPTDQLNKKGENVKAYVSRAAKMRNEGVWSSDPKGAGPHRIFWGHDIFSIHGDNPLSLLIQEYGIGRGVLQAIRHLVADTCSKQGLPIPFSSYFDYIDVSGAHVKNRLLDFCQAYSKEVLGKKQRGFNNEVFNHIFSIHMQDILSVGLAATCIAAYCKGRKIEDKMRTIQMRVIAYMGTVYGSAIIGAATHYGIPFINYPAFLALAKNVTQMVYISNQESRQLMVITEQLICETKSISQRERALNHALISGLYETLAREHSNIGRNMLIDFLGEEN